MDTTNPRWADAYIALGSNISDPLLQLRQACVAFAQHPKITFVACSDFYQNPPMGPIAQPDYINAVAHIRTMLTPQNLLDNLHTIEKAQGRERSIPWGPRTLDLDLLLFGDMIQITPTFSIPHPGLYSRNFVLIPLASIAPNLMLPSGKAVTSYITADMHRTLHQLHTQEVVF